MAQTTQSASFGPTFHPVSSFVGGGDGGFGMGAVEAGVHTVVVVVEWRGRREAVSAPLDGVAVGKGVAVVVVMVVVE